MRGTGSYCNLFYNRRQRVSFLAPDTGEGERLTNSYWECGLSGALQKTANKRIENTGLTTHRGSKKLAAGI
jgi:hypothetical protein